MAPTTTAAIRITVLRELTPTSFLAVPFEGGAERSPCTQHGKSPTVYPSPPPRTNRRSRSCYLRGWGRVRTNPVTNVVGRSDRETKQRFGKNVPNQDPTTLRRRRGRFPSTGCDHRHSPS